MKSTFILAAAILAAGCANNAAPISQSNATTTSNSQSPERAETAIAHSSEKQMPPASNAGNSAPASKWASGGEAIDTTKFDTAIMAAEKKLSSRPSDEGAKKALSAAFYERAVALTDARQYASALGDYRRALKNDPTNDEAKQWVEQITMIYEGLRRPVPAEGQEPPPMPFKKG
jgi:tetratricopeptide (TPR) repeat protein